MNSLTPKGQFVLNCLRQGINVSHKEYDRMWEEFNTTKRWTKCPTCNGTGRITHD